MENSSEHTSLERVCRSSFWDSNLLDSPDPDLTPCFHQTVLVWIPCLYLWVVAPLYLRHLRNCNNKGSDMSPIHRAKTAITMLQLVVMFLELFKTMCEYAAGVEVSAIHFVKPLHLTVTMALAGILIQYEEKKGLKSSRLLFVFWLLAGVCGALTARSKVKALILQEPVEDKFRFMTFCLYFTMVVLQLILYTCSEGQQLAARSTVNAHVNTSPEESCSFLSRITFWWFTPLIKLGYKRPIKAADLYPLKKEETSQVIVPIFDSEWSKELARVKKQDKQKVFNSPHANDQDKKKSDSQPIDKDNASKGKDKMASRSLFSALLRCFWPLLTATAVLQAIMVAVDLTFPQILKLLIGFTRDTSEHHWKGHLYILLLMVFSVGGCLIRRQFIYRCMTLNMHLKTVIKAAVYKKSLTVTSEARKSFTVGSITNLMSVDAERVSNICFDLQHVWSVPFLMVGSLYLLWKTLGVAFLAGVVVLVIQAPIQSWLVSKVKELERIKMEQKDSRIKLMNEVLNGIKVLKLYAWELSFKEKIDAIRAKELKTIQSIVYLRSGLAFIGNCLPILLSLAIFAAYLLMDENNVLDAEKAFVVHSLLDTLRFTFGVLPHLYTNILQAKISLGRIENFLGQDELDPDNVQKNVPDGTPISVHDGTFSWGKGEEPILKDINLSIPDGSLVAVIGQIGSGKSSLLSALLGEMEKQKGTVSVKESTSYVSQQPWIQNATLQDNILFDSPMDKCRYNEVLAACALEPDLEILSKGDQTVIGEKGVNLSGGQKQRVSLARAVYSGASVCYLDDPLSAVDPHVGHHIFDHIIGPNGLLKDKTRLLVTHSTSFLSQCDQIIVLREGRVWLMGHYSSLMENQAFAEYIRTYTSAVDGKQDKAGDDAAEDEKTVINKEHIPNGLKHMDGLISPSSNGVRRRLKKAAHNGDEQQHRRQDIQSTDPSTEQTRQPQKDQKKDSKPTEEEEDNPGKVKLSVLGDYIKHFGVGMFICLCLMCSGHLLVETYAGIWLSEWTEDRRTNSTQATSQSYHRVAVYGALGLAQGVFAMLQHFCVAKGGVMSASSIHNNALSHVLRGTQQYFDTTPIGRIMSRFTQDLDRIDNRICWSIMHWIIVAMFFFCTCFVVSFNTPVYVMILLPMAQLYYYIQRYYTATARQLRSLESKSNAKIYSHFSETLQGVNTIRAFNRHDQFILQNQTKVDEYQTALYHIVMADGWLAIGLDLGGSVSSMFAALLAIVGRGSLSPGTVGLSISSALSNTWVMNVMVHITADLERNMLSLEKMQEYADTPAEADRIVEDHRPPDNWPNEGKVSLNSYQTRYREGLDPVLKDITVNINSGEKIGIVGRTGAGKSSLVLAIFRIIEASGGSIVIDGVDISKIGLHDLRSRITVIPQDPVVFSGTLRMNLDPFEKHSTEDIWKALELSHIKDFVMGLEKQLEHEVTEGGTNLSVGQRQLICLARALLRKSKMLVLDEATASVDPETDALIQSTIRTQFADCTVLTIAHRLNTIMDSTRVLVLDGGKVAEFNTPENLIASSGIFSSMVKDAGLVTQG